MREFQDDTVFSPTAITLETESFNADLKSKLATLPRVWERPPQETRQAQLLGAGVFPPPVYSKRAYWRTITGRGGDIRLRIIPPAVGEAERVYLHIHGGGWVFGRADAQDVMCEKMADALKAVVVSVEYRLAPEDPFPAGPDDCEDAACWLVVHTKSEFGADVLTIGGESAGAHLSVLTLLRMRDNHGYSGFKAANLIYGCFDLSGTPSLLGWGDENLVLDTPTTLWFFDQFLPGIDRRSARVSPLYADLTGLPTALFTVGTLDPLLDDSLFMAQRWHAAGNHAELAVYPGGIHGFNAFLLEISNQANARCYDFLGRW